MGPAFSYIARAVPRGPIHVGLLCALLAYMAERRELLPLDLEACRRIAGARNREEERELDRVLEVHFRIEETGRHVLDISALGCDLRTNFYPPGTHGVTPPPNAIGVRSVKLHYASVTSGDVTAKEANRLRQKRYREKCEPLRAECFARGLTPRKNALFSELQALLDVTPPRNATEADVTQERYSCARASAEFSNSIPNTNTNTQYPLAALANSARANSENDEAKTLHPFVPSPGGLACKAMRVAGLADVNPSHPELLQLLDAGVTAEELADVAREAVAKGKGFAYALATARGRRRDAANAGAVAAKTDALAAWAGPDLAARLRGTTS